MSNYTATVIRSGNSYALRVPKQYVDQSNIKLGQKIQIGTPLVEPVEHDPANIRRAIKNLQQINAFRNIQDPVKWQRQIRRDRDIPGRE